jgi:hypothetical protein
VSFIHPDAVCVIKHGNGRMRACKFGHGAMAPIRRFAPRPVVKFPRESARRANRIGRFTDSDFIKYSVPK